MIGRSVSHYQVLGKLGEGGMGVVYHALDTRLDRHVALKFLPPDLSGDRTARQRFELEARAVSSLDHQNICTVYEVDSADDGRTFIAMPCYDGMALNARVADGPLPHEDVVDIGMQIADGLAQAHRKGVLHRDLKPANILVTEEGVVKIVDFGLARLAGQSRLTSSNLRAGTPAYMSPEQVRGEDADERADIWALGAVLFEMATGRAAFFRDFPEATMYAVLNADHGPLDGVPAPLAAIIDRCLQKDPDDRFASVEEVRSALADLIGISVLWHGQRNYGLVFAAVSLLAVALIVVAGRDVRMSSLTNGLFPQDTPAELHLAVLPLRAISAGTQTDVYARGLTEAISSKLAQLDSYSESSYWVVPTSDIVSRNIVSAQNARKAFGVNYVVDGGVLIEPGNVRLNLAIVDAQSLRQIESWTTDFSDESAAVIQDEAALEVTRRLSVHIDASAEEHLSSGGTADLGANEFYLQGRGYLQRYDDVSNIEAAITLFHRAIDEDPNFILAVAGLAEAHWRLFEATKDVAFADSALVYGRRVEARRPLPAQVYVALGVVYAGTGRLQLALETFDVALERNPENADAFRGRGKALAALERPEEAEAAYLKAIRLKPDYWAGHHDLAVFYYHQNNLEKAAEYFEKEAALTPDNPHPYRNLGAIYFNTEQWTQAQLNLEKSITISPTYQAYSNLATLHYYARRDESAIEAYRNALAISDHNPQVWSFLGTTYHFAGRSQEAREAFQTALKKEQEREHIDPTGSLLNRATIFAFLGEHEKSRESLLHFLEDVSNPAAETAADVALVFEVVGERKVALSWIARALEGGYPEEKLRRRRWLDDLRNDPAYLATVRSVQNQNPPNQ